MSDLKDLQKRALEISRKYDELQRRQGRQVWGAKEHAMGFATDMGELMELVMARENLRHIDDAEAKLAHELGDCLWSVMVLANDCGVDLEVAFAKTMNELKIRLKKAAA